MPWDVPEIIVIELKRPRHHVKYNVSETPWNSLKCFETLLKLLITPPKGSWDPSDWIEFKPLEISYPIKRQQNLTKRPYKAPEIPWNPKGFQVKSKRFHEGFRVVSEGLHGRSRAFQEVFSGISDTFRGISSRLRAFYKHAFRGILGCFGGFQLGESQNDI